MQNKQAAKGSSDKVRAAGAVIPDIAFEVLVKRYIWTIWRRTNRISQFPKGLPTPGRAGRALFCVRRASAFRRGPRRPVRSGIRRLAQTRTGVAVSRGRLSQLKTSNMQSRKITRKTTIHRVIIANDSCMTQLLPRRRQLCLSLWYPPRAGSVRATLLIPPDLHIDRCSCLVFANGINACLVPYTSN